MAAMSTVKQIAEKPIAATHQRSGSYPKMIRATFLRSKVDRRETSGWLPDPDCSHVNCTNLVIQEVVLFLEVFERIWGVACICRPREAAEAKEDQMDGWMDE